MDKCKDCINYDDRDSYPGTGHCYLEDDFVKEDNTCSDFEEA